MSMNYSAWGSFTVAANKTGLYFVNGNTQPRRLFLYDCLWGAQGTPGDQAAEFQVRRITAENMTPGGAAVTPFPVDQANPAAQSNGVEACTGEPTYASGAALEMSLNQRAPFRWVLHPGRECVASASNDAGWGIICNAVTSGWVCSLTMLYSE